jgi:hypothetical protein
MTNDSGHSVAVIAKAKIKLANCRLLEGAG